MEVNKIRQELNELIKNIVEHSESFPANRPIPSLEVSAVIFKVNKMQEHLAVLKFLLESQEKDLKNSGNSHKEKESYPSINTELNENLNNEFSTKQQVIKTKEIRVSEEVVITKTQEEFCSVEKNKPFEIVDKLKRTPIKSLKEAFSLNDRYLYANELFDKNMEAFNNLIKIIDESNNMNEAQEKLITAKTQYNWDEENNFYIELVILAERRFS